MAKVSPVQRVSFAKLTSPAEMPNLLEVQLASFEQFLQADESRFGATEKPRYQQANDENDTV